MSQPPPGVPITSLTPPTLNLPSVIQAQFSPLQQWLFGLEMPMVEIWIALLSGGHVLLEGPPGTAKTLMIKLLAQSVQCPFKRVQFTPDLMPADLIGTSIFNPQTHQFYFSPGPLMTTFLLADEINRAPAKTQSALLECMQEHQVTVDGTSHLLSDAFTVFATQNPLDHEGTYPLPEAQLDRFLMKIIVPYPSPAAEREILHQHHAQSLGQNNMALSATMQEADLLALRQQANAIIVDDSIVGYVIELVTQTRQHPGIAIGASPRAALLWLKAAKSRAFLDSRTYVIPDDVKQTANPVLRHRLILFPQADLEGQTSDTVITEILHAVPVPR